MPANVFLQNIIGFPGITSVPTKDVLENIANSEEEVIRIDSFQDLQSSVGSVADLGCKAVQLEQRP